MSTMLIEEDLLPCPHCLKNQENLTVQKFAYREVGSRQDSGCMWCHEWFSVIHVSEEVFWVEKLRANRRG